MFYRHWKKSAAAAALGIAFFLHAGAAHAATAVKATDSDTFWLLSKKYGVPLDKLMNANPTIDPYNIYAGLSITIPAVSKPGGDTGAGAQAIKAAGSNAPAAANKNTVTVGGKTYDVSDVVQAKASAYTSDPSENGWGPIDYFGNPLKLGTVAVDPKRIPLGSKVYITGYDYDGLPQGGMIGIATDMGSAIKGDRIDIFVPDSQSEARQFGFQYVKVYVLD
ncbi:3D domain-containing protein [Paenibacillus humicola]|uniref:3D domain-containing protein n=1 Tax=Paenibacillus humicola TaxID=3110540 RepID=UPI003B832FF1